MTTYEIERYEIHVQKYMVDADSEAEAIRLILAGSGDIADNEFSEMIEFCESMGMPAGENVELAEQLRKLGVAVGDFIPSIRSVE
jgi:hypothetical protein